MVFIFPHIKITLFEAVCEVISIDLFKLKRYLAAGLFF